MSENNYHSAFVLTAAKGMNTQMFNLDLSKWRKNRKVKKNNVEKQKYRFEVFSDELFYNLFYCYLPYDLEQ